MATPLDRMINSVVTCLKCGAKMGQCDCQSRCSCGWWHDKGKPCRNPETLRCSSKMLYGKPARAAGREEER